LGVIAANISQRAARGESFEQVVAAESADFPPVYRAVIEAGRRAGRLPAALESLARSVRRLNETRRVVMIASIYPLVVLMLIWLFFALFTGWIAPQLYLSFKSFGFPNLAFFRGLAALGQSAVFWGPAGPIVMLLLAEWLRRRLNRSDWIDGRGLGRLFEKLPWIGKMIESSRNAAFAEMLATLLAHDVPLPDALKLAADSVGSARFQLAANRAAENLANGRPMNAGDGLASLPPLLRWMIPAATGGTLMLSTLNHAAETYRHRAEYLAEIIRVYVPLILTAGVAGLMTLAYALCLFVPYASMLKKLAS
jgi:general secretion pathway protein F